MSSKNKERSGYKKTTAGWIPHEWGCRRISQAGEVKGGRQRSPHFTDGKIYPYLRVANIFEGWIDTSDVLEMRFTEPEFDRYCLKAGDILLNEGQSIDLVGRCARYRGEPRNCCYQNTLIRFRPNGCINSEYALTLFTYLQKSGVFSKVASRTTSIAHLGTSRFANISIPIPPDGEQKKIAEILSAWDVAIDQTRKLIDAKKRRKRALMQQLLAGKKRLPGFSSVKWRTLYLSDILKPVSRPVIFKNNERYKLLSVRRGSGGAFFRGDIEGSEILTKNLYVAREDDFLISKMQIVHGASALVTKKLDGAHISGSYVLNFRGSLRI